MQIVLPATTAAAASACFYVSLTDPTHSSLIFLEMKLHLKNEI